MKNSMIRHSMLVPTFDNTGELFHVVVCFSVVNHCSNREDQLGLDLREPVKNTLQQIEREREKDEVKNNKKIKKVRTSITKLEKKCSSLYKLDSKFFSL